MHDETPSGSEESQRPSPTQAIRKFRPPDTLEVDIEDFRSCGWEEGLSEEPSYFSWWHFFLTKGSEANERGELTKSRMLWLLADACSLRLTPIKRNEPLVATEVDEFKHPRDLDSFERFAPLFAQAYPLVDEPLLKARLADIAWLARRPKRVPADALAAIAAYRRAPLDEDGWFLHDSENCWRRGLTLAAGLREQAQPLFKEMSETFRLKVEADLAPDSSSHTVVSMTRVLLELRLAEDRFEHLAELLTKRGEREASEGRFLQARFYLDAARQFFATTQNEERRADLALIAAKSYFDEAHLRTSGPHQSYMVAADLYTSALHELYSIPKGLRAVRDVEPELRRIYGLLREAGARSMDEFSPLQTEPIDISAEVQAAYSEVGDKELIDAMRAFAEASRYVPRALAQEAAQKSIGREFIGRIFSGQHLAADGRMVKRTPASEGGTDNEQADALFTRMVQQQHIHIRYEAAARILPARERLLHDHLIQEQDLLNICLQSRLVPRNRVWLVAKGLKAGFEGDFAAALHLLVPQLENFVRVHLARKGVKTAKLEPDGVLMELGLSTLASMKEMDEVFGPDLTFEIRALFCEQSGPNLRNDMAHGLLEPGATQSAESIYAWWLVFRMVFINYWLPNSSSATPPPEAA